MQIQYGNEGRKTLTGKEEPWKRCSLFETSIIQKIPVSLHFWFEVYGNCATFNLLFSKVATKFIVLEKNGTKIKENCI